MKYLHVECFYRIENEARRELQKCKIKCDELNVG